MKRSILTLVLLAAMAGCKQANDHPGGPDLFNASAFEKEVDGQRVSLYTLTNDNGMAVQLTNYGARLVSIWVPDRNGEFVDVIHGFESIDGYLDAGDRFNGPIVGRYGNRIGNAAFELDGVEYALTVNESGNQLHGGNDGFFAKVWDAVETTDQSGNKAVRMTYYSPDGEEGYPGGMNVQVTYSVTPDNRLVIHYEAETDAPTVVNLTSHAYFNLHGTTKRSTNSHLLTLYASEFTPTDAELIPTGEITAVEGTPLDFRRQTPIGERIADDYEALVFGGGYDHNFILDKEAAGLTSLAAEVYEPENGVVMKVYTDQPAIQFYSGNGMKGADTGKRGDVHGKFSGIALETQNYPDAPNHPNFPSAVLRPGEVYTHTCVYAFDTK